ncbi:MAG: helix-turn-helix domain-containing protein [Lachnospiraceae bacterium]|nr:helix-turn-helix domain-containing protein [Lachnospiraceae bacterium]
MYDKNAIGKRIKALRCITGKTQLEVAREIGISVETIRKLEQGKRGLSLEILDSIKDYYGAELEYILYGDN